MLRKCLQVAVGATAAAGPSQALAARALAVSPWSYGAVLGQQAGPSGSRSYSAEETVVAGPKVQQLADEVVGLTVLEASQLAAILRKRLGMPKPAMGAMPMMSMMAAPAAAGPAPAAAPVEEKKEKTEFDIRLESFSAEGKIKVIKEIRSITSLGLKEAKELVRHA
jgi:large subunit ribosomal protein L7/L12